MFQQIHKQPEPPSARRADLPADIDTLVLKALEKKPADRYQTMAEFQEAISSLGKRFGFSPVTLPEASLDGIPQFQTPGATAVSQPSVRQGSINPAILGAASVVALVGGLLLLSADGEIQAPKRPRGLASQPATPKVEAPLSPTVQIKLTSAPAGAKVYADDRLLGTTPVEVAMDRGDVAVQLRFVAPGHKVMVQTVVPSEDRELTAKLKARKARKARKVRKPRIRTEPKAKPKPSTNLPRIKTTR
jgi:serine/threonine-protein kinase